MHKTTMNISGQFISVVTFELRIVNQWRFDFSNCNRL